MASTHHDGPLCNRAVSLLLAFHAGHVGALGTPSSGRRIGVLEQASANPYEAEKGLELAIDELIQHGRPYAAIRCLHTMCMTSSDSIVDGRSGPCAALESTEGAHSMDAYDSRDHQGTSEDPARNPDDLFRVEWAYLPLLDSQMGPRRSYLNVGLANDRRFFCEVIRLVFIFKKDERPDEEPTEEEDIATNAYRLLSEWRTPPATEKTARTTVTP